MLRSIGLRLFSLMLGMLLLATAGGPRSAQAQSPDKQTPLTDARQMRSILIIDGSGSMWGSIHSKNKIVVVREVLPQTLAPFAGKMTLGIMSYGHRRKGDCRDIQMLTPPSPYGKKHEEKLKRLRARGKTPISFALKKAFKAFPKGSEHNNIILLADGFENCAPKSAPCKVAANLKKKMPGLRIHVIAYGFRKKSSTQNLSCMATRTGGQFFRAYSRRELEQASRRLFASLWQQEKSITDRLMIEKRMKPGLYLGAQLKKNGPFVSQGVKWSIFKGENVPAAGTRPLKQITSKTSRQHIDDLPSGIYFIQANYQGLTAGQPIRIIKGRVYEVNIPLDGGKISLATYTVIAGPLVPRIHYDIFRIEGPNGETETEFLQLDSHQDRLLLPAGKYRIVAKVRNLTMEKTIELAAGDTIPVLFYVNGGQLELQTVLQEGMPPLEDIAYTILRKSKDPDRPYATFLRTRAPRPILELPADKYLLDIQAGLINRTIPVSVEAGKNKQITLNLKGGEVHLKKLSRSSASAALERYPGGFRIYKEGPSSVSFINDPAKALYATTAQAPKIILPTGRYQIVSYEGASLIVRPVEITAQKPKQTVEFNHTAREVSFELQNLQGRRIVRNVFWKIRDAASGQIVYRSSLASPGTILERGEYRILAYYRGRELEKDLNIRGSGKTKKVIMQLQ